MVTDVCSVRRSAGYTVVTLPAEVDAGNADRVREELLGNLDHGPAVLIVDMTATSFCAAAGVHALMRAHRQAAAAGTGLRVAVSVPIVRWLLEITGSSQLLEVLPSLGAAVDDLGAAPPALTARTGRAEETPR
ncbi:MAG TPA: STAS domain-containing protein [Streptosporangiaceae bacterium]|nr:STAS domain-containing protein [Streptosporangiaceae bacterium]